MSFSCHAQPSLICSPAPTEVGKLERNTPQRPPFPPTPLFTPYNSPHKSTGDKYETVLLKTQNLGGNYASSPKAPKPQILQTHE